jgi:8-oxo-dGTP pyrophosphatase MutT (NUDIX family)
MTPAGDLPPSDGPRSVPGTGPADLDLATVRARVAAYAPDIRRRPDDGNWQAATAVVIAPGAGPLEVAFIERAHRPGDRWSGDMALPGGVRDPGDPDLAATAARETYEEIGVTLEREPDGRLDDQRGRTRRGLVASYVYTLDERPDLRPDPTEVAAALWIPLPWLFDPAAATRHRWTGIPFPAIRHEDRIIWGLTHRILGSLAAALQLPNGR